MVAPEGEAPVAVADGHVVELVGGADRRLLGGPQDGVGGLLGGAEGPQPQRRARRGGGPARHCGGGGGGGMVEGEGGGDGADGGGGHVEGRADVVLDRRHRSNGTLFRGIRGDADVWGNRKNRSSAKLRICQKLGSRKGERRRKEEEEEKDLECASDVAVSAGRRSFPVQTPLL